MCVCVFVCVCVCASVYVRGQVRVCEVCVCGVTAPEYMQCACSCLGFMHAFACAVCVCESCRLLGTCALTNFSNWSDRPAII